MRIFYAVPSSPNSRFDSNLWRDNLRGSLVQLGNEIVDFDYDLGATFQNADPSDPEQAKFIAWNRPLLSEALVSQVSKEHTVRPVDLLFTYFNNACVLPGVIRELGITSGLIAWTRHDTVCRAALVRHHVPTIRGGSD